MAIKKEDYDFLYNNLILLKLRLVILQKKKLFWLAIRR